MKDSIEITKHNLVPKHFLLKEEEAKKVLSKYNISFSQLPRISRKDPAILSLGAQPKDVVKIERKSATAGMAVYYRVVVDE